MLEPGSDPKPAPSQPDPLPTLIDQRRLRRMISNRESARRSRMRKQRQLEDLRRHVSRLRLLNTELSNRVGFVLQQNMLVRSDNDRLRCDSRILRDRLSEIRRVLVFQRLSFPSTVTVCGGFGSGNEQSQASLIA